MVGWFVFRIRVVASLAVSGVELMMIDVAVIVCVFLVSSKTSHTLLQSMFGSPRQFKVSPLMEFG